MFKRILKMFGICMAILVVVVGGAVGIYALSGGFKENIVELRVLYIDDKNKAEKEIYTLEDVTTMINCEPFDATNKELIVECTDPIGVLKNVPKAVTAGEEFTLELNKDTMGNNIGGVVTLTFSPPGDKKITDFKLKLVVDTAIPNNSLYFAGNDSDTLTTSGKTITMGINSKPQNIYLKSNLVNAFCLDTSTHGNLKKALISYVYTNQKGEVIEEKTFDNLQYKPNQDPVTKEYNYLYEVPVTPKTPGTIQVTAKMHRTYEIENAYKTGYNGRSFDEMPAYNGFNSNESQMALDAYNAFINKYISFFDTSEESYNFFTKECQMTADGKVILTYSQIETSKKYIFQTCTTSITVTAVNLSGITSIQTPKEYKVLTSKTFNINQLISEYELNVTLDHDDVANINTEKHNLFNTLKIKPYVYVEKEDYLNYRDSLWSDYKQIFGVLEFEDGKPVGVEPLTTADVDGYTGIGYMLLLERDDNSYQDYIDIELPENIDNKIWTFNFNVPLKNDSVANINDVKKALFLEFEVTGRDLKNDTQIVKNTYSRVFIEYTEYSFYDDENAKIGFPSEIKRMAINHNVQNATEYGYTEKLNEQNIDIDLKNTVSNYNQIQYKSVMYFVEEKSNQIEGGDLGPKIASIGKYNFKYMNASTGGTNDMVKYFGTTENLVGERLLNAGTKDNPQYYIRAINASETPAHIFAVVYLSDKNGNPIDINGRKIKIEEIDNVGDPTTLVVFAITDVTETGIEKVYVDSFVENINFYTKVDNSRTIEEEYTDEDKQSQKAVYVAKGFVKRNNIISYTDKEKNHTFSDDKLTEIQNLLTLKLLYRNEFTLYATNFEWDESGSRSAEDGYDADKSVAIKLKDFNGKESTQEYVVNTYYNKQLALNKMCENFNNDYELNINTSNSNPIANTVIMWDEENNAMGIKFTLSVEEKIGTSDDYIYIRAKEGGNVINALEDSKDFVNWKVTKVKAADAKLVNDVETSVKLYSRYKGQYSATNYQEFGRVTKNTSDNTLSYQKYYLYRGLTDVSEGSMDDNLKFEVTSNLGTLKDGNFNLNLDVVDMSQAIYEGGESTPPDGATNDYYADIKSYSDKYLNDSNNVKITYLNPQGLYQLVSDLVFTNEKDSNTNEYDNNIHIGNKAYPITNPGTENAYITVNNQIYNVISNSVTIHKGTYLPIVKGYSDNGDDIVVVLGEEFTVRTKVVQSKVSYVIDNIPESNEYQNPAVIRKIDLSQYNPHDYVNDGTKDPSAKDTALIKDVTDGKVNNATINFLKGGLELKNSLPVFTKDPNGNYKLKEGRVESVDNTPDDFEPCGTGYPGDRYAKTGVKVFLMVTIDGVAFDKPITKVIEYELIQEPIELVAKDAQANISKILDEGVTDVNNSKFILNAGTTVDIGLACVGNVSTSFVAKKDTNDIAGEIYVVGASFETDFYKHCTFKLDGEASGIRFVKSNGENTEYTNIINAGELLAIVGKNDRLIIDIPSNYQGQTAKLKITYPYQDGTIEKELEFQINPNFAFALKPGSEGLTIEDGCYVVNLDANTEHGIQDLFSNYFNIKEGTQLVVSHIDANKSELFPIVSGILKIGKSYAIVDTEADLDDSNPTVSKDYIEFSIKLSDGEKEVQVNNTFKIMINPIYTFDFRGLNNSPKILNGQCLLDTRDYVKVYRGYSINEADLISSTTYYDVLSEIFTIVDAQDQTKDYTEKVVISDINNTLVKNLVLQYNIGLESGSNNTISHEFSVTVRGYEVFFSKTGDMAMIENETHSDYYDRIAYPDGTTKRPTITSATLYVSKNESRDVADYFSVFTKDNDGDFALDVELKKVGDGSYIRSIDKDSVGDYYLTISINKNGNFVRVYDSAISIKVVLVETFCDTAGAMQTHPTYADLSSGSYHLIDIEITDAIDTEVIINNYYHKFFVNNGVDYISVILRNSADYTETYEVDLGTTIRITDETKIYQVCYAIEDVLYNTGFTFTLSPEANA